MKKHICNAHHATTSEPEYVIQFLWVSLFYGHLRHSSKTHLRRFYADSASLILSTSVANVRISEQKAKLITDYFEWECFEWAQIWKIALSIWKIFHKIRAFLDKNPIIALSDPKNPPRAACPMEPRKGVWLYPIPTEKTERRAGYRDCQEKR